MDATIKSTPGSRFVIEPATWRDLNPVRELEKVCFPLDMWPLWDIISVLTLPDVVRLKAVEDGKIVGFVAGDLRPSEHMAWIATIGVLPAYRGMGIGKALLAAAEEKLDMPRIRLCVRVSNSTAISLYEKHGYQRISVWPGYYNNGEDALVMEKIKR